MMRHLPDCTCPRCDTRTSATVHTRDGRHASMRRLNTHSPAVVAQVLATQVIDQPDVDSAARVERLNRVIGKLADLMIAARCKCGLGANCGQCYAPGVYGEEL